MKDLLALNGGQIFYPQWSEQCNFGKKEAIHPFLNHLKSVSGPLFHLWNEIREREREREWIEAQEDERVRTDMNVGGCVVEWEMKSLCASAQVKVLGASKSDILWLCSCEREREREKESVRERESERESSFDTTWHVSNETFSKVPFFQEKWSSPKEGITKNQHGGVNLLSK